MIWQDALITSGSVFFTLSLVPQLRDAIRGHGMNVYSAVLTSIILFMFCAAYYSMGMLWAAIPITATMWAMIAYFSWRRKPHYVNGK